GDHQDNTAAQEADSNSAEAHSSKVDILGLDGVTISDSDIASIAEAGSLIGQLASQSNAADQNQEANSDGGNISQTQSIGDQDNTAAQEADDNSALAGSGPVNVTASQDVAVTGPDSNVKSIATAEVGVGQDAEQANDNSQSQTAASDTGNISQTESLGDQDNTAAQEADENSAKAGSAAVDIPGLDNVTVDDSEVGSIATAGAHISQLAGQFNGNDQFQEANSNAGNISQFQSNGDQDNTAAQEADENSATAGSAEVDITAGDDVAISDSAVKSSATADPEITQE